MIIKAKGGKEEEKDTPEGITIESAYLFFKGEAKMEVDAFSQPTTGI
jgi:hypothetical protein